MNVQIHDRSGQNHRNAGARFYLQRRIAEEALRPDEAALYFCEPGVNGASIHALEIDGFGNITNWPRNFFGDTMQDLAAMTDAAMRRESEAACE